VKKILGVECKKAEIYLALVADGEVVASEPQRLEVARSCAGATTPRPV